MTITSLFCVGALLAAAPSSSSSVSLSPCRLEHPAGLRVAARCGSLEVPAGDKVMSVGFALLPSTSAEPGVPLVMLAGGPGQAATRDFVALGASLERLRQDRDVILVDARGTGRSTPLRCEDARPLADRLAGIGDDEVLAACLAALPVPTAALTTTHVVEDLERIRGALGVERWHVLGVSYGTRVAAMYGVAHPDATASLVLDGVAPLDRALGDDIASDMEASLLGLGAAVRDDFVAVKAALAVTPVTVTVPHPTTAKPLTLTLTAALVNSTVRMSLYADETRAILPVVLKAARAGDYAPMAGAIGVTLDALEGAIHGPVNVAVVCAEDVPFMTDRPHPDDAAFDDERPTMRKSCGSIEPVTAPFRPTRIVPPTLLLSGELDPITPPHHARRAERLFAQHRHLVARQQGHNVLPRGCMSDVVANTLAAIERGAPIDAVDVACLDRLQAFPTFIDGMGPSP
jgi:pimeloyl-ACP methyl ester carboxylesterase